MLFVLFGLAGVGKNYTGEILARALGAHFWDADDLLTTEMERYITQGRNFTPDMVDTFCTDIMHHVKQLQKKHHRLVIAQAFYREIHRQRIKHAFPDADFIHVTAEDDIIFRRIKQRNNQIDVTYAQKMRHAFEWPQMPHQTIWNNQDGPEVIERQIAFLSNDSVST